MSKERKHVRLGFSIWAYGHHPAGWRLPEASVHGSFDGAFTTKMARLSEKAKLDFFFIGDMLAGTPAYQYSNPNQTMRPEALTMAAHVAAVTERLGVITTVNTTYSDPFTVARATATVDNLSNGRLAMNIVTGRAEDAALNYGRERHWDDERRYDWATEYTEILQGLWDSWEDDAFIANKETGQLLDPAKVHRLNYRGQFFSVAGPLNVARPVQGHVPLLHAGKSERSLEYGARFADVRFISALQHERGKAYYADIKSRLAKYGRDEDSQILLGGTTIYVGHSSKQAHDKYREIQDLVITDYDLKALTAALGIDLSTYRLDTPVEDIEALALVSPRGKTIIEQSKHSYGTERITIRELYLTFRRSGGGAEMVGDAKEVADFIEHRFLDRVTDGVVLFPPYMTGGGELFLDLVVPELQRRGLFRTEYAPEHDTLRERLGLARPENTFVKAKREKSLRAPAA